MYSFAVGASKSSIERLLADLPYRLFDHVPVVRESLTFDMNHRPLDYSKVYCLAIVRHGCGYRRGHDFVYCWTVMKAQTSI